MSYIDFVGVLREILISLKIKVVSLWGILFWTDMPSKACVGSLSCWDLWLSLSDIKMVQDGSVELLEVSEIFGKNSFQYV